MQEGRSCRYWGNSACLQSEHGTWKTHLTPSQSTLLNCVKHLYATTCDVFS